MAEEIARLTTVWDANFQKLDEKLSKVIRSHHAATARIRKDADTFTRQLEERYGRAGQALGNVFNDSRLATIQAGAGHLRVFGSALEPLGTAGLAAAAGVAALAVATQQTVAAMQFADEIDDAAQKLNIGTEALQEYRFAMTEVGGEAKDADAALEGFSKTLGAAQSGLSPKAIKGFAALGFTQQDLQSYSSAEEALADIAKGISALSKESERAAVAEKLGLGPMLPLLREGADEMEALRQKARDLGIVMDADLVAKGAQANQEFEVMSQVIGVQLKTAFVELSDEVVSFVTFIADALKGLNDFIDRFQEFSRVTDAVMGDGFTGNLATGNLGGMVRTAWTSIIRGENPLSRLRAAGVVGAASDPDDPALMRQGMAIEDYNRRRPGGSLIRPPERGGGRSGGTRGRDTVEQRERRQAQFDKDLERIQAELLRAWDAEFESIGSDTANKIAQLNHAHAANLKEITDAEAEYVRTGGLRGLATVEADQLRAAQEELRAVEEANLRWEERKALEEYRFQTDQDSAQAAIDLLDIQAGLAVTARDRFEAERRILALTLKAEREAQQHALRDDPEIDDEERARRLEEGDRGRRARYDAQGRSSDGARMARGIAEEMLSPRDWVSDAAEAYAEIDRLREQDVLSEQEAARAKALVWADMNEKRVANTQTMLDTLATLQNSSNKELAAIGKAAAIAQATIDGVLAVQKALASAPPPFNFVQAAIVGAAAAANVAQIAGMADGGLVTGPGGPREDKVLRRLSPGEFVINAASTARNRALLERINGGADMVAGLGPSGLGQRGLGGSLTYAPTIDARGADLAAVARLERIMVEERASFSDRVNGVRDRRARFRLGSRP